jgi:hypothetical protein
MSCIKLSIFFFFHQLVSHMYGQLLTYWWAVLLVCTPLAVYGTVVQFLLCPIFDFERPCRFGSPAVAYYFYIFNYLFLL